MKKIATCLTALALLTPALPALAEEAADAKALFEQKCSTCHGADRATSKKKTAEEWGKLVERMRGNGAQLSDDEAKAIVGYLAKAHGKE